MGKIRDLTGQRFGRLLVNSINGRDKHGNAVWKCICDCGATVIIVKQGLTRKNGTKSCGCLNREITSKRMKIQSKLLFTTHGMSETSIYHAWQGMRDRCDNPNSTFYKNYGGRGIKVCRQWRKFENFYADMGDRPEGKTLDRIDNNGDYEPSNCRWATHREQQNNMRTNHLATYNGKTMTISQWARNKGIARSTLNGRLCRGWNLKEALTTPAGIRYQN